jgi:predicted HD phosphohydrolase
MGRTASAGDAREDATAIWGHCADIGHLLGMKAEHPEHMEDCGIVNHEGIGSEYLLSLGFPQKVARIVRGHVSAKRYLCWKNPSYLAGLSLASTTTLRHQGGPMGDAEAHAFEADPLFETIILMRTWDEKAKVVGLEVPSLDSYVPCMVRLLLGDAEELRGICTESE